MATSSAAQIARRYYEDVWDQGDMEAAEELVAPEIVLNGWAPGLEGLKEVIVGTRRSFPDLKYTIEDVIQEDDKVVVRFLFQGTHRGVYRDIEPTGIEISYSGIGIWRVENGKLVEHWSNVDLYGLMQQLGAIPS